MTSRPQFDRRASGLLLHVTSLPGPHGSGDLGPSAHRFVDFLAAAGQRWWQMLPTVVPGDAPGYSPYSALSAFAGSPWIISPELLGDEKPLSRSDTSRIDFPRTLAHREFALRKAFGRFNRRKKDFDIFCQREKSWLDDWALFAAIKHASGGKKWFDWQKSLRLRKPAALAEARKELAEEIVFHKFVQYEFDRQWSALQTHCRNKGVGLLGDLPIFVAADSCDVWANPELFTLRPDGQPSEISGCPPDLFSKKGQLWGHPQYRWANHKKDGFHWWTRRFATELRRFDGLRVDHFLGFYRTWAIPGDAKDGRKGRWLMTPGEELFAAVHKVVGPAPIIAEDLGLLIPPAAKLRDKLSLPGMRVLQFAFGEDHYYLPHNYVPNCVAYTGTHDNNTVQGWFAGIDKKERAKTLSYLQAKPETIHTDMIRTLMASVAKTVIFPAQDILGLGEESRMNLPGTEGQNWNWRLKPNQLTPVVASQLAEMCVLYDRF